jgi:diguanylate cyclase (GGDEF)-like protein
VQAVLQRARTAGEQARAMLDRLHDPVYEVAVLGNLGEVLLHQGDVEAAEPLLRQSLALAEHSGMTTHAWRIRASLGEGLVKRGQPVQALAAMHALLAEMGAAAPPQTVIRSHQAAYRACRVLGRFEQALHHFETAERMERLRTIAQLRAQSRLFVTRTEAQRAHSLAEDARLDALAQRRRAAEFAASAERDPLTGLGNRRYLDRRCAKLLPALLREGGPLTLVQIDIDHFKQVNDRLGHAAGDRVLVALAGLLRDAMRNSDVLTRHGGEEFVVVLPGMATAQAVEFCERLRLRVADHRWQREVGAAVSVTVSMGLAGAPPYDIAALLHSADQALYRAKAAGRNQLCLA